VMRLTVGVRIELERESSLQFVACYLWAKPVRRRGSWRQ